MESLERWEYAKTKHKMTTKIYLAKPTAKSFWNKCLKMCQEFKSHDFLVSILFRGFLRLKMYLENKTYYFYSLSIWTLGLFKWDLKEKDLLTKYISNLFVISKHDSSPNSNRYLWYWNLIILDFSNVMYWKLLIPPFRSTCPSVCYCGRQI